MTCVRSGNEDGVLERLAYARGERHSKDAEDFSLTTGYILSNLSTGANVRGCPILRSNDNMAAVGFQFNGRGFAITVNEATRFINKYPPIRRHLRPFVNGNDVTQRPRNLWMLDFFGLSEAQLATDFQEAYQHLLVTVKPERDMNPREGRRLRWWVFGEALSTFRPAMEGLNRIAATPITSKHRIFTFLEATAVGDSNVVMVATDDGYCLGVLSSFAHILWAVRDEAAQDDRAGRVATA